MDSEYRMPKLIEKYYRMWANGPTLLEHPSDRDRFYGFVKACIRYSRRRLHGAWLRYFLERDFQKRGPDTEQIDQLISEVVILFEHILDFNKAEFPDHVLEMRNPYTVKLGLGSYLHDDGKGGVRPRYSEKEIERILRDNFGASWEKDYRRRLGLR